MGMPTMWLIRRSLLRELDFLEQHEIPHRQQQLATSAAAYRKFEEDRRPFVPSILITHGREEDSPF
jgi:hypothetical protein